MQKFIRTLGALVALTSLVGCWQPSRPCSSDGDCGGDVCDTKLGACVVAGGGSGGGGGGTSACNPACSAIEECQGTSCAQKYSAIEVSSPSGTVGGPSFLASAKLVLNQGFSYGNEPQLLDYVITQNGTQVGSGTLKPQGAGVYKETVLNPGAGTFTMTVKVQQTNLEGSTTFQVDATPPSFIVTVPARDAGAATATTNFEDPDPQYAAAWRRDQVAPVEIRAADTDVQSAAVQLFGTDGGTQTYQATAFTPCDAGYCGVAQVKLYQVAMDAFRTRLPIRVTGADQYGNAASQDGGSVAVTRWKWAFDAASGAIAGAPGLGRFGTVYFGTSSSSSAGSVIAVSPNGQLVWANAVGSVLTSPAVGTGDGGQELIYVSSTSTQASLQVLEAADGGGNAARCSSSGTSVGQVVLTRADTGFGPAETAISTLSTASNGRILVLRPNLDQVDQCDAFTIGTSQPQSPAVTSGSTFYAAQNKNITAFSIGATFAPLSGFNADAGYYAKTFGLAGADLVGSGGNGDSIGALFSIPITGAQAVTNLHPPLADARVNTFVLDMTRTAFFSVEPSGDFLSFGLDDGGVRTLGASGVLEATPAIGENSVLYTASTTGTVSAWSTNSGGKVWELNGAPASRAGLTLDCPRDSAGNKLPEIPGVLYVAGTDGKLYSFVVDSRGIDTTAKWPKWQHDPRNTGNADVSLSEFDCGP